MKAKVSKKVIAATFGVAITAAMVGSISGAVAWYQYSTRSNAAFTGTSAHATQNLKIKLSNDTDWANSAWASDLSALAIQDYLLHSNNLSIQRFDTALRPVTAGVQEKDGELNQLKSNPINEYPAQKDWANASLVEDYIELPLQLKVVDNDGAATEHRLAKDIYLSDLNLKERIVDPAQQPIIDALRVHFSAPENQILLSNDGADVVAHGELDLNGDGINDYLKDDSKFDFVSKGNFSHLPGELVLLHVVDDNGTPGDDSDDIHTYSLHEFNPYGGWVAHGLHDDEANRPAAAPANNGMHFLAEDTGKIFLSDGSAWSVVTASIAEASELPDVEVIADLPQRGDIYRSSSDSKYYGYDGAEWFEIDNIYVDPFEERRNYVDYGVDFIFNSDDEMANIGDIYQVSGVYKVLEEGGFVNFPSEITELEAVYDTTAAREAAPVAFLGNIVLDKEANKLYIAVDTGTDGVADAYNEMRDVAAGDIFRVGNDPELSIYELVSDDPSPVYEYNVYGEVKADVQKAPVVPQKGYIAKLSSNYYRFDGQSWVVSEAKSESYNNYEKGAGKAIADDADPNNILGGKVLGRTIGFVENVNDLPNANQEDGDVYLVGSGAAARYYTYTGGAWKTADLEDELANRYEHGTSDPLDEPADGAEFYATDSGKYYVYSVAEHDWAEKEYSEYLNIVVTIFLEGWQELATGEAYDTIAALNLAAIADANVKKTSHFVRADGNIYAYNETSGLWEVGEGSNVWATDAYAHAGFNIDFTFTSTAHKVHNI